MLKYILFLILLLESSIKYSEAQNIYLSHTIEKDSIFFNFKNQGTDSAFLFSTYFGYFYKEAKGLHKLNKKEHIYKISFLPIIKYLEKPTGTSKDELWLSSDRLFRIWQNEYQFLAIPPADSLTMNFSLITLFSDDRSGYLAYKDYNNLTISRKDLKPLKKIKGDYKLQFEFAIFNRSGISSKEPLDKYLTLKDIVQRNPVLLIEYAKTHKEISDKDNLDINNLLNGDRNW